MANTITAFHTFTAGTRARSGEVDENFSNFRGDIIPINTNAESASDLTHNLGTTDHRWLNGYIDTVLFADQTTVGLSIRGNAGGTAVEILAGNTVTATFEPTAGMTRISLGQYNATSAADGSLKGILRYGDGGAFQTSASFALQTWNVVPKGSIVKCEFIPKDRSISGAGTVTSLQISNQTTTFAGVFEWQSVVVRNGTTIAVYAISTWGGKNTTTVDDVSSVYIPLSMMNWIDTGATPGVTNTYSMTLKPNTAIATNATRIEFNYVSFLLYEP